MRSPGRMDWAGTLTFGVGLTVLLIGITYGIQPYGESTTGWTNPKVLAAIIGGRRCWWCSASSNSGCATAVDVRLFRSAAFGMSNLAGLMSSVGRGGFTVHAHHLAAGHLASVARLQL